MRLALLAIALCSACTDPDYVVEIGELLYVDRQPQIEAPAEASVGEPFPIVVFTLGGQCLVHDSTDIVLTADGGTIVTPYDRRLINRDRPCQLAGIPQRHEADVVFEQPGEQTFVVRHRPPAPAPTGGYQIVDIEVVITVR